MPNAGETCTTNDCHIVLSQAGLFCHKCMDEYNFTYREIKLLAENPVDECPEKLQKKVEYLQSEEKYTDTKITNYTIEN